MSERLTTVGEASEIINKVGKLVCMLRDSIRELGLDAAVVQAAEVVPDARERLDYVIQMTSQAANRVLNCVETIQSCQTQLEKNGNNLKLRWDEYFSDPTESSVDVRTLMEDTHDYFSQLPQQTGFTQEQLLEIMMAQDFQDLTGQVIRRMMGMLQEVEKQLLMVLLEYMPDLANKQHKGSQSLLNGPALNKESSMVVADQQQVDDLLDSLGF